MKGRRIIMNSLTLGRSFTQEAWGAYLMEHPDSSSEVVISHGGFGFNVYGVCLTPYRVIIHAKAGSMKYGEIASVSVAQSPCGAWTAASDASSDITSPHFAVDPSKPWCYKTAEEAIYAGLQQLEKKLMQERHWVEQMEAARRKREGDDEDLEEKGRNSARLSRVKKLLKGTREKMDYYDPKQMLLF